MKKVLLNIAVIITVICVFASCSNIPKAAPAHPGEISLYAASADMSEIPEYQAAVNSEQLPAVISTTPDSSRQPAQSKTVTFRGEEYQTKFMLSYNLFLRHYTYDAYICGSVADSNLTEFHIMSDENDKLVGFRRNVNVSELSQTGTKTEAELIEIATAALDELTDADYYAHTYVEFVGEFRSYTVWFYNSIGDIWLADTSYVELAVDGTVIAVEALPEPELLRAANFSELDIDEFDAVIEARMAQSYPNYSCDNDKMLATVTNNGSEIKNRKITMDDEGVPFMWYDVSPQLTYDITYRGEWASTVTSHGENVHQTGTSRPLVYAVVYLADQ